MRAACCENDPAKFADHQRRDSDRYTDPYPLTVGETYDIHAMMFYTDRFLFLVLDDHSYPRTYPAACFHAFDGTIPPDWKFALGEGIRADGMALLADPVVALWGYPEWVDDPGHYNGLVEGDRHALKVFEDRTRQTVSTQDQAPQVPTHVEEVAESSASDPAGDSTEPRSASGGGQTFGGSFGTATSSRWRDSTERQLYQALIDRGVDLDSPMPDIVTADMECVDDEILDLIIYWQLSTNIMRVQLGLLPVSLQLPMTLAERDARSQGNQTEVDRLVRQREAKLRERRGGAEDAPSGPLLD